jgi:lysophospholipase L1-like esterase
MTGHVGSRTDSYILTGDQTSSASFSGATVTAHWYTITGIDVQAPSTAGCVVALGNSITDGYGLSGGLNNRWTDYFSQKLLSNSSTSQVGVLNMGIGGTTLRGSGASRYQQDVLKQSGIKWVIIFYGVNDIGNGATATQITDAYKQMISSARSNNIKVYGATITPFNGHSYYTMAHESVRQSVNTWIRTAGNFDGYIDFDQTIRNPNDATRLQSAYSNDWLHPNAAGYKLLGESINLSLFSSSSSDSTNVYLEAECGTVRSLFSVASNSTAPNSTYATVKAGNNVTASAPADATGCITLPFSVSAAGTYSIWLRTICPDANGDSFWLKMDNGSFVR